MCLHPSHHLYSLNIYKKTFIVIAKWKFWKIPIVFIYHQISIRKEMVEQTWIKLISLFLSLSQIIYFFCSSWYSILLPYCIAQHQMILDDRQNTHILCLNVSFTFYQSINQSIMYWGRLFQSNGSVHHHFIIKQTRYNEPKRKK